MGERIRRSARMRPCAVRLPGCRGDRAETVFAHAPSVDNGMGLKTAPDWWGTYACQFCHDVIDDRIDFPDHELVARRLLAGIYETQKYLFSTGLLVQKG